MGSSLCKHPLASSYAIPNLPPSSRSRYGADVDVNHQLASRGPGQALRPLTTLVVCPLYISAAYHNLPCFRLLLQAGANPDFNCWGPINVQGFSRGSPVCVLDAVLRHGCEPAFVRLLVDFGANLNLVKVEALGVEATGRVKVNAEALEVFKEARGEWVWVPEALWKGCLEVKVLLRWWGGCSSLQGPSAIR